MNRQRAMILASLLLGISGVFYFAFHLRGRKNGSLTPAGSGPGSKQKVNQSPTGGKADGREVSSDCMPEGKPVIRVLQDPLPPKLKARNGIVQGNLQMYVAKENAERPQVELRFWRRSPNQDDICQRCGKRECIRRLIPDQPGEVCFMRMWGKGEHRPTDRVEISGGIGFGTKADTISRMRVAIVDESYDFPTGDVMRFGKSYQIRIRGDRIRDLTQGRAILVVPNADQMGANDVVYFDMITNEIWPPEPVSPKNFVIEGRIQAGVLYPRRSYKVVYSEKAGVPTIQKGLTNNKGLTDNAFSLEVNSLGGILTLSETGSEDPVLFCVKKVSGGRVELPRDADLVYSESHAVSVRIGLPDEGFPSAPLPSNKIGYYAYWLERDDLPGLALVADAITKKEAKGFFDSKTITLRYTPGKYQLIFCDPRSRTKRSLGYIIIPDSQEKAPGVLFPVKIESAE